MDKYVARYFKDDEFVAEREFYAEDFDSADHKATELVDIWTWNYMTLYKV